jgi:FKBP-type peptidyl-prolyl cis-trans isomerase (trigger factor)
MVSLPDMIKMSPETNVKIRLCLATWPHKQKISATTRRIDEMMKNMAALVTASEKHRSKKAFQR